MPSTKKHHLKKKPKFTVKRFKKLVNKPDISKKGISYSVEKAENIDEKTGKKTEGDIFKKYQDGVLKRQVFVSKAREKKIIKKQIEKKKNMGGNQQQNQQQPQPQVVIVQDGTELDKTFKSSAVGGLGSGLGFGIGISIIDAIFGN
jgi:hypothetical protein